jgi:hypothetical protein
MRRSLAFATFFCLVATTGFAQSRLNGKWATPRPAEPPLTEAQRKQNVQLEVTIVDGNASGSLASGGLGGTFHTFKDRKVTDNRFQFRTEPMLEDQAYTIELVDDNTVMYYLSRVVPPVGPSHVPSVAHSTTVAQAGATDSVRGIVQDPSGALIPGVTVTARNVDTNATRTTITDEAGRYSFLTVVPGKYTVAAALSGFQTVTATDLSLGNAPLLQDFTLGIMKPTTPTPASCALAKLGCHLLQRVK